MSFRRRHVHIYMAAGWRLLPGWEKFLEPYQPLKKKVTEEEDAARRQKHLDSQMSKLESRIDLLDIAKTVAVVFDFWSDSKLKTDHVVIPPADDPSVTATAFRIDDSKAKPGEVSAAFLKKVSDTIRKNTPEGERAEDIDPSNVAFRAKDGTFVRHLIRCGAMRTGRLYDSGILPSLYFATSSFSWKSVLCPEKDGDLDHMMQQLPMKLTKEDPVDRELQTTLQLYALAGLLHSCEF